MDDKNTEEENQEKKTDKEPKEKESENSESNLGNRNVPNTKKNLSIIEEAKEAADELRKANEEKKNLLDREEKLMAERELGGKSQMSIPIKETEDEKWAKDAKIRYEGTGMDPTPTKAE